MRILHVWCQSGVASILAKYQRRLGHASVVIKRRGYDKYGIDKYYSVNLFRGSSPKFYLHIIKIQRHFDVIHIHSLWKLLPFIVKPKVMHFHGSDLRNMKLSTLFLIRRMKTKMLVSTPDLLNLLPKAEWLPNPIDIELFHPDGEKKHSFLPIPYEKMPSHLRSLDVYFENKPWFLSKSSLEALACGTKVVWNGLQINPPLSPLYHPLDVAKRTIEIYEEVMKE